MGVCIEARPAVNPGNMPHRWMKCGKVTHVFAAECCAVRCGIHDGFIETRDEGSDVIFEHHVKRVTTFIVTPLRKDAHASEA